MSQTTTIPQAVYAHYHACYNNDTYRAFSLGLAHALGLDERVVRAEMHDEHHNRIMNQLTDAAMELVGAEFYAGAGKRLGNALGAFDEHTPNLVNLAAAHLNNFVTEEQPWVARQKIAHLATLALAEHAHRALVQTLDHAALLPGWRGTAPYYWLRACSLLVQAAEIVLRDDPSESYLVEKFNQALQALQMGTGEITRYNANSPATIRRFHEQMGAMQDGRHPDVS
jgi:hypothetical protein